MEETITCDGPTRESLRPLRNSVNHIALDPRTQTAYGIARTQILKFDRDSVQPKTIEQDGDAAAMNWLAGAAFDTKRHQLIVASRGGEAGLCAYSPDDQRWTRLTRRDV